MPTVGETKTRFNRSYVYTNPVINGSLTGSGTWRLTSVDTVGLTALNLTAVVDSSSSTIGENRLIYIDTSGKAHLANASALSTAKVAGITIDSAAAGATITYTRNQPVTLSSITTIVDSNSSGNLTIGSYYYLSASTAGNLTATPDSSTSGAVVIPVGLAISASSLLVEIQEPKVNS
mgnify:CR=1 FL=1|tara:strand:- start:1650 stop:2180 length:531 start_codon:yes stop_codon:yes gene_type:complete